MSTKPQQASAPGSGEPFNAGDEESVRERNATAKVRDEAVKEGLRFVMSTAKGRAWMRHLLAAKLFTRVGKIRPAAIFTGNSTTFFNAGLKELGDLISTEIAVICPTEFRLMEDEGEPNAR